MANIHFASIFIFYSLFFLNFTFSAFLLTKLLFECLKLFLFSHFDTDYLLFSTNLSLPL